MNRHLGATYSLSVLIVVATAIAFRGQDGRPAAKAAVVQPVSRQAVAPAPRPEPPRAVAVAHPPAAPRPALAPTPAPASPRPAPPRVEPPAARTVARTNPRPAPMPRGAFARAEPGESLADAARRIYGTEDRAEALWRANRDQLPSPSSPLTAGMVLRTP